MSCNNHGEGEVTSELPLATLNKEAKTQILQNEIYAVDCVQWPEEEAKLEELLQKLYLNRKLPPEMLRHIFRYCDDKVLLSNRLVCKNWKLAFDSSSDIIGRFTFAIYDWHTFNESTIVDCVKSARICKALEWNVNNQNLPVFCTRIGKSVRKISFDFVKPKNEQKEEFINRASIITASLLSACQQLDELQILNGDVVRYSALSNTPPIPALSSSSCENVRTLALTLLANENPDTLKKFVDKFPNMAKLQMTQENGSNSISQMLTNNFLCEFIKVNNGSLKEIQLEGFGSYPIRSWLKFIFTSANHDVQLTFLNADEKKSNSELDVYLFLLYVPTDDAPINEKTCARYEKARLNIQGARQMPTTNRLGYYTRIKYFEIVFFRPAVLEELAFLPRIANNFKTLELIDAWQHNENQELEENIILCPPAAFVCGFPSLLNLKLHGNLFGFTSAQPNQAFSWFFLYFPNLQSISIKGSMYNLGEHLIVHLSKLETLEEMNLTLLDNLTDEMLYRALPIPERASSNQ